MTQLLIDLVKALEGEHVEFIDDVVQFSVGDVEFEAYVKEGAKRLRIKAMLGVDADSVVHEWVSRQRQPSSGVLEVVDNGDGSLQPRLVFERPLARNEWHLDPLMTQAQGYRAAWHAGDHVPAPP